MSKKLRFAPHALELLGGNKIACNGFAFHHAIFWDASFSPGSAPESSRLVHKLFWSALRWTVPVASLAGDHFRSPSYFQSKSLAVGTHETTRI
jgi:hypothetical protein